MERIYSSVIASRRADIRGIEYPRLPTIPARTTISDRERCEFVNYLNPRPPPPGRNSILAVQKFILFISSTLSWMSMNRGSERHRVFIQRSDQIGQTVVCLTRKSAISLFPAPSVSLHSVGQILFFFFFFFFNSQGHAILKRKGNSNMKKFV